MTIQSNPTTKRDIQIGLFLLVVLCIVPFTPADRYLLGQLVLFMIYAAVAMQWNLLFGFAGIFSLASLMFFGIGAYAMAMFNVYLGVAIWAAIPLAAIVALAVSLPLGFATLRLSGVYTTLMTLAFAQVVYVLVATDTACFLKTATACNPFTGGASGFYGFSDFGTRQVFKGNWLTANYYIVLSAVALTIVATLVLVRSSFGRALVAMRDNSAYAQALGVSRLRVHLQVFAISAFFTGLIGAFYAGHIRTVSPTVMSLSQMLYLVAAAVLGGTGRFWGPTIGLVALMAADEVLRDYGSARQIGIGVILMLAPLFLKAGLLGLRMPSIRRADQV